jgi:co-chaperonin GroES (HSP10)
MSALPFRLRPVNRHLLVTPHVAKNETTSGVLLPDDFKPDEDRYIEATVIDIALDCSPQFKYLNHGNVDNKKIIVDRAMIEEVKLKEETHYMILENYVVGVYRRPDED